MGEFGCPVSLVLGTPAQPAAAAEALRRRVGDIEAEPERCCFVHMNALYRSDDYFRTLIKRAGLDIISAKV